MAKTYYSEYVNHCLRFYARYDKCKTNNRVNLKNWLSCEKALAEFTENDREVLLAIYREGDTVADNVYNLSKQKGISQSTVWKLINQLERKVAVYRELL